MGKVLVAGSTGRMGLEIIQILDSDSDLNYEVGLSSEKTSHKKTVKKLSEVSAKSVDVVIDFTSPDFSLELAQWCEKNTKPLVSGTTGFTNEQQKKFFSFSKKIPLLHATNMSLGVAVLRRALSALGPLSDYGFQIVETHHAEKKDKPSGTAKTLQSTLEKVVNKKLPEVLSIRGGGVFGIHSVQALGEEEILEFKHEALNRAVFARGAIQAAKFLLKQKPGQYSIDDVLGNP